MRWVALAVCQLLSASDAGSPRGTADKQALPQLLARLDALQLRRDQGAALAEAHRLAAEALAVAPSDFGALWRAARVRVAESEQPSQSPAERSRLGKEAYDLAEQAIAANPNDVAGHYWAVLGIGNYAQGIGVLRALASGVEGKFKKPLERATALDERYDHGGIPVIWAAYYLELPWPKRDRARAAQYLQRALAINPANLRARLYQARIAIDEDRPAEARARLAEIASASVGKYDPPEERRVKQEAAALARKVP